MCGILVVFNKKIINLEQIQAQLAAITHRGPDDSGIWQNIEKNLVLGSQRLAVQDLSPKGHMPMHTSDERYHIVFNGEIYNYPNLKEELLAMGYFFRSNSDTEVILYAYQHFGPSFLTKLKGMFAMAIYDSLENTIFFARDIVGEKPLYLWEHEQGVSLASELKQLFLDPCLERRLNPSALQSYMQNGYTKPGECFIQNVIKVKAAHYGIYNLSTQSLIIQRYWELPLPPKQSLDNFEVVDQLDHLLSKAVKQQLISDVPLGVLLSGGVDSSLITAYTSQFNTSKVKTFHISFSGHSKYNESEYARSVANYFDTEHIELSGNEIGFNLLDQIVEYFDEPMADSSILPTMLVAQLTKKYVTVALGGDGGDELFAGYTSYLQLLAKEKKIDQVPNLIRKLADKGAGKLPIGIKGKNYLHSLEGNIWERFQKNRLFDVKSIEKIIGDATPQKKMNVPEDILYSMTSFDFYNYLCEDILTKVDRASMSYSLEMRAPWLDKDVIEFAFGAVKSDQKLADNKLKSIPKQLLQKKMVIPFDLERKQGFSIPLNEWIAGKWHLSFMDIINEAPEFINKKELNIMLVNTKKGYTNSSRLFAMVMLIKWLKKYDIQF
jgi:asparagine synthase (glutamine-hydrolysing)